MRPAPAPLRILPGILAALLLAGCAAHAPVPATLPVEARPAAAMLPLENLSGKAEYGDRLTRMVEVLLGSSGRFRVAETGEVDRAMAEARIRSASSVTREQLQGFAASVGARWLIAGTVIECGTVRTPDGEVPSLSLALRMIDGRTGRTVWTEMRAHSGEDRETVFGWGRETSLEQLADRTVRELIDAIRFPAAADSLSQGGNR
jgi:hypothetical protein